MKKINLLLRICTIGLFMLIFIFGCKKIENSYTPENEASLIKTWLETMVKNKQNIDTTSTGLYYIVNKVGAGRTIHEGDSVTVQYSGMFLNGTVFDSSASFSYIHKATGQRMIQGWEEGIEVLSKGGSAVFLIPSDKGYGPYGGGPIPPYTPLLFVIDVIDIK